MVIADETSGRVRVRALVCPQCGAGIPDRSFGYAQTIACPSCSAVLDASDPALAILQAAQRRNAPQVDKRRGFGNRVLSSGPGVHHEFLGAFRRAARL